ncbi:SycD/LcrH family type III secretion system chaperone [Erwinia amylovora]|uniref:SycD/LcrH family type III secretion system chaperone n=1 Tax=Erwinia amylovora TaxID=552 RepID=UPI001CBEB7AC|nr:SycD/LcrH family type III secretion system chaperone [Erwinia amylovora]MBZ2397909.1 SycD/LcrH family type III secretion system chaperone [Erwinia amylovora]
MEYENMAEDSNSQDPSKNDDELEEYSANLIEAIQNGAVLKDVQCVSNGTMNDIYKIAYEFYHIGRLDDAISLFRFLCIYDFYNSEYAMGLAAVYHLKKDFRKAIDFYALSYSLSKEDYRPMFYAGQCNLMLRQEVLSRKCFAIVMNRCTDLQLKEKAETYLSALDEINADTKSDCEDKKNKQEEQ